MIRLSRLADYGIVLLTYFVDDTPRVLTARQLAQASQLPLPTVAKVLKALCRAHLLGSRRGTHGGYCLERPAEAISVADIISAIEGPIAMTECVTATPGTCGLEEACPMRPNWQRINQAVRATLGSLTLAAMGRPVAMVGVTPTHLKAQPVTGCRPLHPLRSTP